MISCRMLLLMIVLQFVQSVASTPTAAQDTATAQAIKLEIRPDRDDAIYEVGQTATFTISASAGGSPVKDLQLDYVLSTDGYQPQAPKSVRLVDGMAKVTGQLDKPGFLMIKIVHGKTSVLAAAGFDPLKIEPSLPMPDDFDQFWAQQKSQLAAIPAKPVLTPVDSPVKNVEAFDVQVACVGAPVSGYFGRPVGAKAKSLPAILLVHGAGVGSSSLGSVRWASEGQGMLTLDINAHGIPNGKPAEFYQQLNQGELKEYRTRGRTNRDDVYFRGMFLRLIRAIDFLTSQPEWDGKHLVVYGSSQGGFQALAAAGLDERVTFICAGVPAGCDHTGSQADRISGWPKLVAVDAQGKPDPASLTTARYYDAVNFARRAKCQGAAVTVGFIDTTCPPTSVYAAYNALKMSKSMHADILAGHNNTPAASAFMRAAALKHCQPK